MGLPPFVADDDSRPRFVRACASSAASAGPAGAAAVTLRVYAGKALVSPGSLYKSVLCHRGMTAAEVIASVLERYGEPGSPADFALMYVVSSDTSGIAGSPTAKTAGAAASLTLKSSKPHTLGADDKPLLVAESFGEGTRRWAKDDRPGSRASVNPPPRFELGRKEAAKESAGVFKRISASFRRSAGSIKITVFRTDLHVGKVVLESPLWTGRPWQSSSRSSTQLGASPASPVAPAPTPPRSTLAAPEAASPPPLPPSPAPSPSVAARRVNLTMSSALSAAPPVAAPPAQATYTQTGNDGSRVSFL